MPGEDRERIERGYGAYDRILLEERKEDPEGPAPAGVDFCPLSNQISESRIPIQLDASGLHCRFRDRLVARLTECVCTKIKYRSYTPNQQAISRKSESALS